MDDKERTKIKCPSGFPGDVSDYFLWYFEKYGDSSEEQIIQRRLLADSRMEKTWELICKEEDIERLRENLFEFFFGIPEALTAGKKIRNSHTDLDVKDGTEALSSCNRAIKSLEKQLRSLKKLQPPKKFLSSINDSLIGLENWLQNEQRHIEFRKKDEPWMFQEVIPLKKLNKGAEKFDETYAFLILGHLFRKYSGKPHVSMIADTVMVMKDAPEAKREDYRSRASKVIKSHLSKLPHS